MRKCEPIILFFSLAFIQGAQAATFQAASCSQADVQNAVNSANPGDTVSVPAGSCTWGSTLTLTKGITLQGVGQTSTVITANGNFIIDVEASGGNYRITGFGFTGTEGGNWAGAGLTFFAGTWNTLRMDHCKFNFTQATHNAVLVGYPLTFTETPKALFDHITFSSSVANGNFMKIQGSNVYSWQEDDNYGTDKAIFIEDSTFTWPDGYVGSVTDSEGGARMVIRYNTMKNCGVMMHDTGSTQGMRGNRLIEMYGNNIPGCTGGGDCNDMVGLSIRGGTGVVYNNTIGSGFWLPMRQQTFGPQAPRWWRDPLGDMGLCDNIPDSICSTFAGHCLSTGSPCYGSWDCADCRWHCTTNAECNPGGAGTAVCLSQFDGQLHDSSYPDPGWPCRDQNGRGKDDPVTHMNTASPIYVWNNKDENGNLITLPPDPNFPAYTQEGRDYCNHDTSTACGSKVAWSYTPYTYPHPLQGGVQPHFLPEQTIEAESGALSEMQTGVSGSDTYVYTSTDYTGSASFTFDIQNQGKYMMQARVNANGDGGQNSFYVGLDNEPAQGNESYGYGIMPPPSAFTWSNVSRAGPPLLDPMVWDLSQGLHTFTFYGRESKTWLDQIILRACQKADSNCDGCVSQPELMSFISRWYVNNQDVTLKETIEAIGLWKKGGC